jgi:hypothetical protein
MYALAEKAIITNDASARPNGLAIAERKRDKAHRHGWPGERTGSRNTDAIRRAIRETNPNINQRFGTRNVIQFRWRVGGISSLALALGAALQRHHGHVGRA